MKLGLATCYDLRFPELFRALALRGAEFSGACGIHSGDGKGSLGAADSSTGY